MTCRTVKQLWSQCSSLKSVSWKIPKQCSYLSTKPPNSYEILVPTDDAKKIFASKTTFELVRAAALLKICSYPFIVSNAKQIWEFGTSTFGVTITNFAVRHSFGAHFIGGEDEETMHPTMVLLSKAGIGTIPDYAAEGDVEESPEIATSRPASDDAKPVLIKVAKKSLLDRHMGSFEKTHFYPGEDRFEDNKSIFLRSIICAAVQPRVGFAAIKLTALLHANILMKYGTTCAAIRAMFPLPSQEDINRFVMPVRMTALQAHLQVLHPRLTAQHFKEFAAALNVDEASGSIDYLSWLSFWDQYWDSERFLSAFDMPLPTPEEFSQLRNCELRVREIADVAQDKNVHLMVDAEQTYFQPAIDFLVRRVQRDYNKETPIIFNTFQCYLKDSHDRMMVDIRISERNKWFFGAKLVRGAYLVQERDRCLALNLPDPIHATIEDTHANYNRCMEEIVARVAGGCCVIVASHNEETVQRTLMAINKYKLPKTKGVFFGQLLGMSDNISYSLGAAGYSVYKYVPYGPTEKVVPYLIRRMQENSSVLDNAQVMKERRMIWNELKERLTQEQ